MVDKVNGKAAAGEFLGKNLDFYTVTMTLTSANALLPASYDTTAKKISGIVEKAVETISINGQPIMLSGDALTAVADGASKTIKFAIEHTGSWGQDADTGAKLVADKTQDAEATLAAALNAVPGISAAAVTLLATI